MTRRTSRRVSGSFISTSSFMLFFQRTAKSLNFFSVNLINKTIQISHKKGQVSSFQVFFQKPKDITSGFQICKMHHRFFFYLLRFMNVEDTKCTKNEAYRFINKRMVSVLPVFGFCLKYTQFVLLVFNGFCMIWMSTAHRPSKNLQKAE